MFPPDGQVGETGVDFLDRPSTWKEGTGWIYNDDADHVAFDEVMGKKIISTSFV